MKIHPDASHLAREAFDECEAVRRRYGTLEFSREGKIAESFLRLSNILKEHEGEVAHLKSELLEAREEAGKLRVHADSQDEDRFDVKMANEQAAKAVLARDVALEDNRWLRLLVGDACNLATRYIEAGENDIGIDISVERRRIADCRDRATYGIKLGAGAGRDQTPLNADGTVAVLPIADAVIASGVKHDAEPRIDLLARAVVQFDHDLHASRVREKTLADAAQLTRTARCSDLHDCKDAPDHDANCAISLADDQLGRLLIETGIPLDVVEEGFMLKADQGPHAVAAREVIAEMTNAVSNWAPYNSAHEGYGILAEEFDEFEEHVFMNQKKRNLASMRHEAIQIAAVAMRIAAEVCNEDVGRR